MQTLPLGLARFLSVVEDTTGALYAFCVMVLIPGLDHLPARAEGVHHRPDLGRDEGLTPMRWSWLNNRFVYTFGGHRARGARSGTSTSPSTTTA